MTNYFRDKDAYLKQYPHIKKWLNDCIICHSIGYKPEMPQEIHPGVMAQNIRKMFCPLSVNAISICEDCGKHMNEE